MLSINDAIPSPMVARYHELAVQTRIVIHSGYDS